MSHLPERDQFLQFLRERGMRVTRERLALFEEIYEQHEHIDADRLWSAMQARDLKISRATVYRNLDLMVECGLVRKHRLGRNRYLFEHIHAGQEHDHLVCTRCGRVVEFVSPGIAAMQAEICRAHGFLPARHNLQIQGLCVGCTEAPTSSEAPARERDLPRRNGSGEAMPKKQSGRSAAAPFLVLAWWLAAMVGGPAFATPQAPPAATSTATPAVTISAPADEGVPATLTPEEAAASSPSKEPKQDVVVFDRVTVVGSAELSSRIPGSAHFLGAAQLKEQSFDDIQRILHQVPGVNVQEEEGFGLRPNIGMRGTGVERSQKITLLEDGVLIAPAPYAAPAAYYFPTAGRMEGIEVRKGSSSIIQGPYTNGGVINLLSRSVPATFSVQVDAAGGEDRARRFDGLVGDSRERFGWLVQTFQLETDGFKQLDGGGSTGFELADYLGKLRFDSGADARLYQALELKLGATDQRGSETYLGLTEADFAANPFRRYVGSERDQIRTDHGQQQLRHFLQAGPRVDLTTTVYNNDYFRNWYKLESVAGVSASNVLADPARYASEVAIARGELETAEGPLALRNNRRDYYSRGVESILGWDLGGDRARHELEFGVRYHEDQEDRFQEEDRYDVVDGRLELNRLGDPGSNANRLAGAEALAFYAQDQIRFGRWTVVPGLRFESIDLLRTDFGRNDPRRLGEELQLRRNQVDVWIPGLGATFQASERWNLLAGVHKGFSPPGPGSTREVDPEESLNCEAGFRYAGGQLSLGVIGFYNDYDNLLGTDTVSSGGGGTGDQFNGGRVEVKGLEIDASGDLGRSRSWRLAVPVRLAYTYTSAEFRSSFATSFEDWAPQVEVGDELPYLPENQWSLALGLVDRRWAAHASVSHADAMRTTAGQGAIPGGQGTDAYLLVDLSTSWQLLKNLRLYGRMRNLTDEVYIAARRPAGLRPGLPRTALVGVSWEIGNQ